MSALADALARLDARPYPAYRDLRGRPWALGPVTVVLEHVQGDPFAAPSRLRVEAHPALPPAATRSAAARRATADLIHRGLAAGLGTGGRDRVGIAPLGPEVLERTAVGVAADGRVTLRLTAGLPAAGRRIRGRAASVLLAEHLPHAVATVLDGLAAAGLVRHVEIVEDQVALRGQLATRGLVAFLAEDSALPRASGADDRPLADAVPLAVPAELAVELTAPHAGRLRGLGIPEGVTLIVGGGYHGKSTLLAAIAQGVWDHAPGDGRERCVTIASAVSVRAEDGRAVTGVDLRPFLAHLPGDRPVDRFTTTDASGSTSQAAAIVEALEAGATALLVDEDTAATNFMIRDARMRRLVPEAAEPITPFLDRVRQIREERGVSSVLVIGGAGDWLDVADRVVRMEAYRPADATAAAREVVRALPLGAGAPRARGPWPSAAPRIPDPASLDPRRGARERVRAVEARAIEFGAEVIDVSLLEQLADAAQCRMLGDALRALRALCDRRRDVPGLLDALDALIAERGLEAVCEPGFGDRALGRRFEVAAALNRLRSLHLTTL